MEHSSEKVKNISASGIRKFFELVKGMEDVVSLGVGEPDFITPWHIREASIYAIEQGYTMYTSNYGLMELRVEIARYLQESYGIWYEPETEILVTTGVSEAFDLALRAILNPGDEVIIHEPCYVSYKPCTILAGGVPVIIPTGINNEFKITTAQIEQVITERTKALILSYPNNPTGAVLNRQELESIAKLAQKHHHLLIISDEIYGELTYDDPHTCFAALPGMKDRTILLKGFSKAFAMTGWRIGYVAAAPDIIEAMTRIHQYTMLCAPISAQMAAIEALRNGKPEMQRMINEYNRRRKVILKGLNDIRLECFEPKGAFYTFPSIKSTGLSSAEFSERLLLEQKVAVVPGSAFGGSGEGYVRCSYATSLDNINEALTRMQRFLEKISQ